MSDLVAGLTNTGSLFWFCEICGQQRYGKKEIIKHLAKRHKIAEFDEADNNIYRKNRRAHVGKIQKD